MRIALAAVSLALAACHGAGTVAPIPTPTPSVDRGPTELALDGAPNGLAWDAEAARLVIADDEHGRLVAWQDGRAFSVIVDLGSDGGLGQPLALPDGTWLVTRFGGGTAGAIVAIPPDGPPAPVPGLAPTRRRIGLGRGDDGAIYEAWFERGDTRAGGVSRVELDGGETDVIADLGKPIGVVAIGDTLYVSDQEAGAILQRVDGETSVHATVDKPDLLAAGPDGSLFVGDGGGRVLQVLADGSVRELATGLRSVRGVAYDAVNARLFVAERDRDGDAHRLRIVPVD